MMCLRHRHRLWKVKAWSDEDMFNDARMDAALPAAYGL